MFANDPKLDMMPFNGLAGMVLPGLPGLPEVLEGIGRPRFPSRVELAAVAAISDVLWAGHDALKEVLPTPSTTGAAAFDKSELLRRLAAGAEVPAAEATLVAPGTSHTTIASSCTSEAAISESIPGPPGAVATASHLGAATACGSMGAGAQAPNVTSADTSASHGSDCRSPAEDAGHVGAAAFHDAPCTSAEGAVSQAEDASAANALAAPSQGADATGAGGGSRNFPVAFSMPPKMPGLSAAPASLLKGGADEDELTGASEKRSDHTMSIIEKAMKTAQAAASASRAVATMKTTGPPPKKSSLAMPFPSKSATFKAELAALTAELKAASAMREGERATQADATMAVAANADAAVEGQSDESDSESKSKAKVKRKKKVASKKRRRRAASSSRSRSRSHSRSCRRSPSRRKKRSSVFTQKPAKDVSDAGIVKPTRATLWDKSGLLECAKPDKEAERAAEGSNAGSGSATSSTAKVDKHVPGWCQDLVAEVPPTAPPTAGPCSKKVLRMTQVQIRCLLGRGGETVQNIIRRTGAQIQIMSSPQALEGDVMVAGRLQEAEKMIRDVLASKGCPLATGGGVGLAADAPGIIQVPTELVGALIGPRGTCLNEIKAAVGNAVIIQVLPYITADGCQCVQIAGDNWLSAKQLVVTRLETLKVSNPGRWNTPGFGTGPVDIVAMAKAAKGGGKGTSLSL